MKAGYKQTEIGVIPDDWDALPIGSSTEFKNGLNKAKAFFGYGTPIVNYMDVFKHFGMNRSDIAGLVSVTTDEQSAYSARKGDVFFTRTSETVDEIGVSAVLLEDVEKAVFSGFILRGRDKAGTEGFHLDFKKYCFSSEPVRKQIRSSASYTTRALTNGNLLAKVLVPTPRDPDEQKAIAGALSDVDGLIAGLEALIAKKCSLKTATMQQLLTGKTRLTGFGEGVGMKQTELGELPEDWDVVALGSLGVWKGGGTPSMQNPLFWDNGKIPWLSSGEIKEPEISGSKMMITSKAVEASSTIIVPVGSIITVMRSGILRKYFPVSTNTVPVAINQDLKTLIPNDDQCGEFIFHSLWHENSRILANCVKTGTTVESVEFKWLKAFNIAMPREPIEQREIAVVLNDQDNEVLHLSGKLSKAKALKQGMMQELLTGRTRLI